LHRRRRVRIFLRRRLLFRRGFGLLRAFAGLMFGPLGWALKIRIIGAVIYFVLRLISPSTARRVTDSFSDTPSGS